MDEPQTCGEGLAENSVIPAQLGVVTATMAAVLEMHTRALDLTDPNAKAEGEAYRELIHLYHEIATKLRAAADRMAGYRDLPMGRHDAEAMTTAAPLDAFEQFVEAKAELVRLLQRQAERDETMLRQMRGAIDASG